MKDSIDTLEDRVRVLEADVAHLRAQLAQALALVQRGGQLIPDWRGALRMVERWVRQDYSAAVVKQMPR